MLKSWSCFHYISHQYPIHIPQKMKVIVIFLPTGSSSLSDTIHISERGGISSRSLKPSATNQPWALVTLYRSEKVWKGSRHAHHIDALRGSLLSLEAYFPNHWEWLNRTIENEIPRNRRVTPKNHFYGSVETCENPNFDHSRAILSTLSLINAQIPKDWICWSINPVISI